MISIDEAKARVRAFGQQISADILAEIKSLYAPLQVPVAAGEISITRDIAYGEHSRHRLDVFTPGNRAALTGDVLLFVHGGGFVTGDKQESPGLFYDNVGLWAARQGLVGITINYRLAPDDAWPAGLEDVAAAVNWAARNVATCGGNPRRIFLFGHSAGAAHVAGCIAHGNAADIAGAICLSGIYDLSVTPVNATYFGSDATQYAVRSSLSGLAQSPVPLLVGLAEHDPEFIQRHALSLLHERLNARHTLPHFARINGHNHFSSVLHLNSPDSSLADELTRFMKAIRRSGGTRSAASA